MLKRLFTIFTQLNSVYEATYTCTKYQREYSLGVEKKMACATLKRNLDWESMAQLPAKRRRCAPFAASSSTSPGIKVSESRSSSSFGENVSAPAKLTPGLFIFIYLGLYIFNMNSLKNKS